MGVEIDYLKVGEGERGGDAIAFRFGNLYGNRSEYKVVVIDGGTRDSGVRLAEVIERNYNTDVIDAAFLTHPDGDHAYGLVEIVNRLRVKMLLMHCPWSHASEILNLFHDGRITDSSLEIRIRASLQAAHDLETTALQNGIPIFEAFAGMNVFEGAIRVLGPTKGYYTSLLPDFRGTPKAKQSLAQKAYFGLKDGLTWVSDNFQGYETLDEPAEGTYAENNSSMILLLEADYRKFLFTGDAGVPALVAAADFANLYGIDLSDLWFLHVPHHGSRRNLGPSILNRIRANFAYISCPAGGDPKHPSRRVVNALFRRGTSVYTTADTDIRHSLDAPTRFGLIPIAPLKFYNEVEE